MEIFDKSKELPVAAKTVVGLKLKLSSLKDHLEEEWRFPNTTREVDSVRLSIFFEGFIGALEKCEEDRADNFVKGSHELYRDVVHKILVKIVFNKPGVDLSKAFSKLPKNADNSVGEVLIALSLRGTAYRETARPELSETTRAPFVSSGGGYGGGALFLGGGVHAEIDPNELQSMEEKAVRKLVEKIGETVLWGPEQEVSLLRYDDFKGEYVRIEDREDIVDEIDRQQGWASLRAEFFAELVDLNIDSKVGYVPSHLAMQKADDDLASQRHIVLIITDLTVIADGANAHAEEGNVAIVDWNAVELVEPTHLVIAPIADSEMAKLFGIPVDDRDEEEMDEANTSDNDARELSEDVDE
ncbi:hypothetical protein D1007_51198 [Hordeum vulgare]|nr:hypothetical protein D1007_51198 [Hordeum vulgare]